jgi:hypothetical protein
MASRPPRNGNSIAARLRNDPGRQRHIQAARGARLAKLGLREPMGLDMPWLSLNPMRPSVPDKGWLSFNDPDEVTRQWDTQRPVATFEAVFHKRDEISFAIVRPRVTLHLETDKQCLVEFAVWGNVFGTSTTRFEVMTEGNTVTADVADAAEDSVAVLCRGWAQLRLWIPDGGSIGQGGGWAFYGVTVTPLD